MGGILGSPSAALAASPWFCLAGRAAAGRRMTARWLDGDVALAARAFEAKRESCWQHIESVVDCCADVGRECFVPKGTQNRSFDDCCGARAMQGLADRIRLLVPTSDIHDLAGLTMLLKVVITIIHTHSLDAWEVLAQVLTRRAVMRYDKLIENGGHAFFDTVPEQREEAMAVGRELNYAAQFSEAFFQALWYSHAQRSAQAPVEVDFAELLPAFSGTLRNYETVQAALDVLTYSPLGRNGQSFSLPRPADSPREAVVLVVTVVGAWADVGVVTFWSVLRHCTAPLRVFVFGDAAGLRDWRRMLGEARQAAPGLVEAVRFDYVDVFANPRMRAYLARLPPGCAQTNMSIALFSRLICHELLPPDVNRAIAMDLGDVLVFDDVVDLWRQGDLLRDDELMAAASHRSLEESWRATKPTNFNGGVVLYEVSRMRRANYTEDTLRAAREGLERGYNHFCAWDQDIINVMHEDLWGGRGVRTLPCRWMLFPVTGWQFFWNTPGFWPRGLSGRRYPGLLAANHVEHFCPDEMGLMHSIFAFEQDDKIEYVREMALVQGFQNRQPGATVYAPDGSPCICGERAALLHVPSTMKLWPWVHRLFDHHSPTFARPSGKGANFKLRKEQGPELGGGFWGGESAKDLEATDAAMLSFAADRGLTMEAGNCSTLPTTPNAYSRVDFRGWDRPLSFTVAARTTTATDAHVLVGNITSFPAGQRFAGNGLEVVFGLHDDTASAIRLGVHGATLASHAGSTLQRPEGLSWASVWVRLDASGLVEAGAGEAGSSALMRAQVPPTLASTWAASNIYVGSPLERTEQWVVCHA